MQPRVKSGGLLLLLLLFPLTLPGRPHLLRALTSYSDAAGEGCLRLALKTCIMQRRLGLCVGLPWASG